METLKAHEIPMKIEQGLAHHQDQPASSHANPFTMNYLPFPYATLMAAMLALSLSQPLSAQTLADAVDQPTLSISATPAPEIAVEDPTGTILLNGSETVDFGSKDVGTTVTKTFTIRNLGTVDSLSGLVLSMTGTHTSDFQVDALGATSLAAGASTTFTVTFEPSEEGTKSADIHIASNDADENPFVIHLTGASIPYTYTIDAGQVTITRYTGYGDKIVIPSTIDGLPVVSIGDHAFRNQYGLTRVTIPNSVTRIGVMAFSYCSQLTEISVDPLNPNFSSFEGVLFNQDKSLLIQCPGGKTGVYTIPSSVTNI